MSDSTQWYLLMRNDGSLPSIAHSAGQTCVSSIHARDQGDLCFWLSGMRCVLWLRAALGRRGGR